MWTRAQLKANAKYAMRGRYGKCLLASLAADAIPVLYSLLITIVTYATIIPLYIICNFIDLVKVFVGMYMTKKDTWIQNLAK